MISHEKREINILCRVKILLTGTTAQKPNVIDAVKAGVSNSIVKPFTEDRIAKKHEKVFES